MSPGPVTPKTIYLPGLNGLRAIAALAVVISHITFWLKEFGLNNKILGTDKAGNAIGFPFATHGVTIFFTLSGFLITFLLLKEKETGAIKTRNFYIRRILRIWPLYYLYFIICLLTILCYGLAFNSGSIPFYIFLAANIPAIFGNPLPLLGHYWSLGVEEQFYLFFPHIAKCPNKKLLKITVALIVIFFFLKVSFWALQRRYGIEIPYKTTCVTPFHTLLIGAAGAILYYFQNRKFLFITTHWLTQIISWGAICLIAINKFHIHSLLETEFVSLVSLLLIMGQITKRNRIINLENKVCDFIGKISYGIYVIHQLLIFYLARLLGRLADTTFNYLLVYFTVISTTILLAFLSYRFYEKRFLNLKAKYTTIKSAGTKNVA